MPTVVNKELENYKPKQGRQNPFLHQKRSKETLCNEIVFVECSKDLDESNKI